jgi:hypothetical protein
MYEEVRGQLCCELLRACFWRRQGCAHTAHTLICQDGTVPDVCCSGFTANITLLCCACACASNKLNFLLLLLLLLFQMQEWLQD